MLKIFKTKLLDLTGGRYITRYVTKYKDKFMPVSMAMEYDDDAKAIQRILYEIVSKNLFKHPLYDWEIDDRYYLVWSLTDKEVKDLMVEAKLKEIEEDFI